MSPVGLALVALAATAVRLLYVVLQTATQALDVDFVAGDSVLYLELARSIASGQGFALDGRPTAYVGPGYPLFLTLLVAMGGGPLAIGLAQSVLGGATAAIAAASAAELAQEASPDDHRLVALLAGAGVALYPHLVFWSGYILTETLFVFLAAAALYATLRSLRGRSGRWALAAGLLCAAASLTRPPFLAVAAAVLVWRWLAVLRGYPRRDVVAAALLALGLVLPLAAWGARNALALGYPVITTTESGAVFYQGNARGATGGSGGYVSRGDFPPLDLPVDLDEVQRDSAYFRQALRDIVADPFGTIARWPAKVWNMWRPTYEGASPRNGFVTLVTYIPTLLLGLAGATLLMRGGAFAPSALPGLFLVVWFGEHVAATGMIRFRLPAELVLLVVAPFAVLALARRWGPHQ